jgi:RHS repeat-associated protein
MQKKAEYGMNLSIAPLLYINTSTDCSLKDYYPFGMLMPGRNFSSEDYRFGFNDKENDNEVYGTSNFQNYGMRMYDPRLARFPSVDPLTSKYPMLTPYQFASNNPIELIDVDGLEGAKPAETNAQTGTSTSAIDNTANPINVTPHPFEIPNSRLSAAESQGIVKSSDPSIYDDPQNAGSIGTSGLIGQGIIYGLQGEGMGAIARTAIRGGGRFLKMADEASGAMITNSFKSISKFATVNSSIVQSDALATSQARSYFKNIALTADFNTAPGEAVFYSGSLENAVLAQKFALANGKKTISMTPGGQLLQGMYGPQSLLTRQDADEIMKLASARFADGASGELNAFVAGAKADRIFLSLEEPILMSKGATVIKH